MFSQVSQVLDGIKNRIDRLGDVVVHPVDSLFLGLNLLGRNFAVCGEQVCHDGTDAGRILASGAVEQSSEIDGIDGLDYLGDERLLCCLTEFKTLFEFAPDISGGFDLCGRASWHRRDKRTGISGLNPGHCVRKGGVPDSGQENAKVAILSSSKCGGN